jgi:hypothetical protein
LPRQHQRAGITGDPLRVSSNLAESSFDQRVLFKRTRGMLGLATAPIGKFDPLFREVEQVKSLCKFRDVVCQVQCLGSVVQIVVLLAHRVKFPETFQFKSPDEPINEAVVVPFHRSIRNSQLAVNRSHSPTLAARRRPAISLGRTPESLAAAICAKPRRPSGAQQVVYTWCELS